MPATAMTSCNTPASLFSTVGASLVNAPLLAWPLDEVEWLAPFASSQVAVFLLKYSEDDSRLTAGCLDRAMATVSARQADCNGRDRVRCDDSGYSMEGTKRETEFVNPGGGSVDVLVCEMDRSRIACGCTFFPKKVPASSFRLWRTLTRKASWHLKA